MKVCDIISFHCKILHYLKKGENNPSKCKVKNAWLFCFLKGWSEKNRIKINKNIDPIHYYYFNNFCEDRKRGKKSKRTVNIIFPKNQNQVFIKMNSCLLTVNKNRNGL